MATKEQERKALEKIRKIIGELGEDSYIGTAFEGCLEVAEENIENDWMCSMKQIAESADAKTRKAENKIIETEKNLQDSQDEIKKLKFELEKANKKNFERKEMEVFEMLLKSALYEYREKAEQQAQIIVAFATSPDAPSFKEAVKKHRSYTEAVKDYERCLDNIRLRMEE